MLVVTWPGNLSPRSSTWPLPAALARSGLVSDNNRGQLVTVTVAGGWQRACSAGCAGDAYRGPAQRLDGKKRVTEYVKRACLVLACGSAEDVHGGSDEDI